jgi:hypothetical protein
MSNKKFTILHWWLIVIALVLVGDMLSLTLTGWESWASIIANGFAIIIAFIVFIKWLLRQIKIHNPIKITYLIPDSSKFIGAPPQELKPVKLNVGIGRYEIMILHTQKMTLTQASPPFIELDGNETNKPIKLPLKKHPFVTGQTLDAQRQLLDVDWHGNTIPKKGKQGIQYLASVVGFITLPLETIGNWKGNIAITFRVVETDKPITVRLPLEVSDIADKDQIPFLKK